MYDYLCDTLFKIPMSPVGPEVVIPDFQDLDGNIVKGHWVEANFDAFSESNRPAPVFAANRYPYQLPARPADTEVQSVAQHWLLWYLHYPWEEVADFSDEKIDQDVRREVQLVVNSLGFDRVDYVWYRNPAASVPDMFHVQVFWIAIVDTAVWVQSIDSKMLKNEQSLRSERDAIEKKFKEDRSVKKDRQGFEDEITGYLNMVNKFKEAGDLKKMDDNLEHILALKEHLEHARYKAEKVREKEVLLGWDPSDFEKLSEAIERLQPYDDLWELVYRWTSEEKKWMRGPLFQLEPEVSCKETFQCGRSIEQLVHDLLHRKVSLRASFLTLTVFQTIDEETNESILRCIDNRRLWALKEYAKRSGKDPLMVNVSLFSHSTLKQVQRFIHNSDPTDGKDVLLRKNKQKKWSYRR
eukprot:symbB.v1.2.009564.t1/scaffold598.1/size183230/6